jgi:hypothetical protein
MVTLPTDAATFAIRDRESFGQAVTARPSEALLTDVTDAS